jgi:hypothetical protein
MAKSICNTLQALQCKDQNIMSRTHTLETHDAEQKIRTASETNWEIVLRERLLQAGDSKKRAGRKHEHHPALETENEQLTRRRRGLDDVPKQRCKQQSTSIKR